MDFNYTEIQGMLRDSLARYLANTYDFDQRRAALASPAGWRPSVWQAFAEELGILGAALPEALGGFGGGGVENMLIMEELGKALVVEPYLPTVVIGGGFLRHGSHGQAAEVASEIISGQARFAFAWAEPTSRANLHDVATTARQDGASYVLNGRKAVVVGAPWATHFIVTARTAGNQRDREGLAAFLIPAHTSGIVLRSYPTVDGARAAEMSLDNVRVEASALLTHATDGFAVIERVVDEAIAATCAEAVGALRKLQEGTLDYSRQRKQFGAPIGSFQVIQHRLVDMFMELEQSVSATLMATLKLDAPHDERAKFVSAAKVQISKACKFIGQNAIQIHGGMGMTDELAIGHYFKRTTIIEGLYGSAEHHLKRFESLSRSSSALAQGKRAA